MDMEHSPLTAQEEEAKRNAIIAYALLLVGLFTGIAFIAGGIWALISKDNARGTRFQDHFDNAVHIFIWGLVLGIIFGLLTMILIGVPLLIALGIWILYRAIKGLINVTSDRPYGIYR